MNHGRLMDRVYRLQRHFYDATRWFFLPGRDEMLKGIEIRPGDRVLEIGCGTARNLIKLARKHPEARFYGLDASSEMLKTAQRKVRRAGLKGRIELRQCLAGELDHKGTFNVYEPFDTAFFSYSLTMMPMCLEAFDAALRNVKPGSTLHIVDFWDQKGLPRPFRWALGKWLRMFHVEHKPELIRHMEELGRRNGNSLIITPRFGRYALVARFRQSPST